MKILLESNGNHSNRLIQLVHWEAYCLEYKQRFLNLCFSDMYRYYTNPDVPCFCRIIYWVIRIILKIQNLLGISIITVYTFNNENYAKMYGMNSLATNAIVFGWFFRCHNLVAKYKDKIIQEYSLKSLYYEDNELYKKIQMIDREEKKIVGVHIRRGDYKEWLGGKYYYEDDVYLNYMSRLSEILYQKGKSVFFIIFSNEEISLKSKDMEYSLSRNEWYVDQFLMSRCDYIIGPPSTFSSWSSWIGEVQLYHITEKEHYKEFSLLDFKISEI